MIKQIFYRDTFFYPAALTAWILMMLLFHANYRYFPKPMSSSMQQVELAQVFKQDKVLTANINELHEALKTETREDQKGHILHNIGVAYYDYYKVSKSRARLDSAMYYFEESIEQNSHIARFYYNIGRASMEYNDMEKARLYYEKTIELDSTHILALHNVGLLNYFEFHRLDEARKYLEKVLRINPRMPITNYVLGEIAYEEKDFESALRYYKNETDAFALSAQTVKENKLPAAAGSIEYAASMALYKLAILYSTKFPNRELAQTSIHHFLKLERNPQRREEAIENMKKYWKIK